ncbi:MAG: hypothetical protein WCR07_01935 [Verrucomicrobiota bacterium]
MRDKGEEYDNGEMRGGLYWAQKLQAVSSKAGPFLVVLLGLLLALLFIPWPGGEDEGGVRRSLPSRYLRERKIQQTRQALEKDGLAASLDGWSKLLGEIPSDARLMRLLLDDVRPSDVSALDGLGGAEAFGQRLLQLGQTNRDDVVRVIRIHASLGNWAEVRDWAGRIGTNGTAEVAGWLARAYLDEGDVMAFDQLWTTFSGDFSRDVGMAPWRVAADAILKESISVEDAARSLAGSKGNDSMGQGTLRLLRIVARAKGDVEGERRLLEELRLANETRASDWIGHLELMARKGSVDDASLVESRIAEARLRPGAVGDAMARLMALGKGTTAKALLAKAVAENRADPGVAILRPIPLTLEADWDGAVAMAAAMRRQQAMAGMVDSVACFIEGSAQEATGGDVRAQQAFLEMEIAPVRDPIRALQFAEVFSDLSLVSSNAVHPARVWRLVKALQKSAPESPSYWRIRAVVAGRAEEASDMLLSATKASSLEPASHPATARWVRALWLAGGHDAEALSLSKVLVSGTPVEAAWRVQHAMLLASSGSPADARKILSETRPSTIPASLRDEVQHAWLEVHVAAKEWELAREVAKGLQRTRMEPLVSRRFHQRVASIPQ